MQRVSQLAEFTGKDCDFQHIRDAGLEEQDPFFWAKIQGQRLVFNPWNPGSPHRQSATHMLVFTVDPAEGCDEANFGMCGYPAHVWTANLDEDDIPVWSLVFEKENAYPASRRAMRRFMRQWHLERLPGGKPPTQGSQRCGEIVKQVCGVAGDRAEAVIYLGRLPRGRTSKASGLVVIADRMQQEICFRFTGTATAAAKAFDSAAFRKDLARMVVGEAYRTPPAHGLWGATCQTQHAHDPRLGGWANFVNAHLSVLAILEKMRSLGFRVRVDDEGGYWKGRNLGRLAKRMNEQNAFLAGVLGLMKDAASRDGAELRSAMDGRPDFEQLEMTAHKGKLGDLLKKIKRAGRKPPSE